MLLNRHRGLANLHHLVALLLIGLLFWVYAEFTILVLADWVRLTRETVLLPYFLCVVLGLLLGGRQVGSAGWRLTRLELPEAAGLATRQMGIVALVVFAMMFATQDRSISRLFLGSFLVLSWAVLLGLHLALPRRIARQFYGGSARVPTLLVGPAAARAAADAWSLAREHLGIEPVGFVSWEEPTPGEPRDATWLGGVEELPELLGRARVGQVILWELPEDSSRGRRVVEACQEAGARLLVRHEVDDRLGHPVAAVEVQGQHYFTLHPEPLEEPINRVLKRVFDVVVALPVVVLILPPLCVLVWVMQRLQSPGPLFFVRPRAGAQRESFAMVKFRTMRVAHPDEHAERRQARADDDRVFPFGRFMRRHSLDEFPQFWNVLTGDMSIVGPRPVMPLLDEEFERRARAYRTRHFVKPGITGLAQSEGFRGEISTPELLQERVRRDLHYIAHWSFWLDVQITLRTLWQVFFPPKSAY